MCKPHTRMTSLTCKGSTLGTRDWTTRTKLWQLVMSQAVGRWTTLFPIWSNTRKTPVTSLSATRIRLLRSKLSFSILRLKRLPSWLATKRKQRSCLKRRASTALFWCRSKVCSRRSRPRPSKMVEKWTSSGACQCHSHAPTTSTRLRKRKNVRQSMTLRSATTSWMLFVSTLRVSRPLPACWMSLSSRTLKESRRTSRPTSNVV